MTLSFDNYSLDGFQDEMFAADGSVRPATRLLLERLNGMGAEEINRRRAQAEAELLNMGITFTVYKEESGIERIFPFDLVPRVIPGDEWTRLEQGLVQRIEALNLFLSDVYSDQRIIADGVIPREIVESSAGFLRPCIGFKPPLGVWTHISGIDLVRGDDGEFAVLEDNIRTPSGVSYVLENRSVMKRVFPRLFEAQQVRPVDSYADDLWETLAHVAPQGAGDEPVIVVLTPGIYNSAYFEHSYLAREMGVTLVEGRDLVVDDDGYVKMRTTRGLERVDVVYRRIDDTFIDPKAFNPESLLGVPGIWEAYRNGRVTLANALGNGIADDKVVYAYVPKMIRYYLDQDPIIPNVETWVCAEKDHLEHVAANIDKLVVKAANESGGYGMLIGPHATKEECETFRGLVRANPRNYIAQPMLALSRCPTIIGEEFAGRHVDLRPYALYGDGVRVLPGGLTRVALRKGSLVVNSSQGGGSKDTWVVDSSNGGFQSQSQGAA